MSADISKKAFLTLAEAEEFFGISAETIRKWITRPPHEGVPALKAFKPGRQIMIDRKDFENYVKRFPAA